MDSSQATSNTSVSSIYSKKFQSIARWVVLIVLWVIIFSIAIGKAGITNFMTLLRERDILLLTVQELAKQNESIHEDLFNFKTSRMVQERYLKQNFGYVEQDEFVFQFKPENMDNKNAGI